MILTLLVVLSVDDGIAVAIVAADVVVIVVLLVGQSLMTNEKITLCIISTHGREAWFSF